MSKMKTLLAKIKKHGINGTILFVLGTIGYRIWKPFYLFYLKYFVRINFNQILFMSYPNYSGNSKALYDYLVEKADQYQIVWLFDHNGDLPANTKRTKFIRKDSQFHHGSTFSALKKIASSKYLFFTHGSPMQEIKKKNSQIIFNLWHGCGYKAAENKGRPWIQVNPFDYGLVPGQLFIPTKEAFWGCTREQILPIGYPQYDYLLSPSDKGHEFIQKLKGDGNKLIIWMPTFRNTGKEEYPEEKMKTVFDIPLVKSLDEIIRLDQLCEKSKIVLCVKRHIYQLRYSCEDYQFHNIRFISNDDLSGAGAELYSILRYTDALISDYSSVAFDYLLVDRPIAFCLDDFEEYKNTRGFVFEDPLEYMPGHHLYKFEDMKGFIEDVCAGRDQYIEQRAKVRAVAQNPCGNYCQRVWKAVRELEEDNSYSK